MEDYLEINKEVSAKDMTCSWKDCDVILLGTTVNYMSDDKLYEILSDESK